MPRQVLLLACAALALAGCSTAPVLAPAPAPAPPVAPVAVEVAPAHVTYPAIGVDAATSPTGLAADGTVEVPPLEQAEQVEFLNWSAALAPGRPAVLVSHVNGRNTAGEVIPGGFGNLHNAKVGDLIQLDLSDGSTGAYEVTASELFPKTGFPTRIYDARPTPTLILITCDGALVDHSFQSNRIVTAVAA